MAVAVSFLGEEAVVRELGGCDCREAAVVERIANSLQRDRLATLC
jgi:hypothetical protein